MEKNIITLKNEEVWMVDTIESNCKNIIQFESEVNDHVDFLYINIPENSIIEFDKKINAPNLKMVMISGGGAEIFIRDFNTYFKEIPDLTAVNLHSTGIVEIPDFILQSTHLEQLSFRHEKIKEMPTDLFNLQQLKNLSFEYVTNIIQVPDRIKRLPNLEWFDLWSANLEYISPELFKLPILKHVNFAYSRYMPSEETKEALQNWLSRNDIGRFTCWDEPDK